MELCHLISQLKQISLTVVGVGELSEKIKNLKFENIKLKSDISDEVLYKLYENSDIVILPSMEMEGFGLIIVESILCGTPVIASDRSGGGYKFFIRNQ